MAMLKTCSCGKAIAMNESSCKECKEERKERYKSYDKYKRNETSRKFYQSKEWKRLRHLIIERDAGLCQRCLNKGKITSGSICHHIEELKDNWGKRLDINNLELVCQSCHSQIHSAN